MRANASSTPRLVQEDQRLRGAKPDRFGLYHVHYRYVVPGGTRPADPVLHAGSGFVLELEHARDRPPLLASQLGASAGRRCFWTLGGVAIVVVLGMLLRVAGAAAPRRVLAARKIGVRLGGQSHELRTPLTSIRMYADMLKEGWVKDGDDGARTTSD